MNNIMQYCADNTLSDESIAYANCFEPLLEALGWPGERQHLIEALPYLLSKLDLNLFLKTMHVLRYQHESFHADIQFLNPVFTPCLFVSDNQQVMLILNIRDNVITVFDGLSAKQKELMKPKLSGKVVIFKPIETVTTSYEKANWFNSILFKFKNLFYYALLTSFVLNFLMLFVPLFSMVIYDQVIPSESLNILSGFFIGILIALVGIAALQYIQAAILQYAGTKINNDVSHAILERLLFLTPHHMESASVSAQISRIRDFDNIRDFLTSPLFILFFDLPFVAIFILTIAILGGTLVFIPIIMAGVYYIIFALLKPWMSSTIEKSAMAYSQKQNLTLESLENIRTIKYTCSLNTWQDRFRHLSANSAFAGFSVNFVSSLVNIISDMLMFLTAIAIVTFGAIKILEGSMTVGALIATMMLTWRILSPLKTLFANQTQFKKIRSSIRQVNTLMTIETERDPRIIATLPTSFHGQVRFNRVTVRYPNTQDPALMNVNFMANAGEVVAITGRNGSGKSTIFKLLLSLYKPQAGSILIDGQDIRQMDPFELRRTIGYLPQKPFIFSGSILENLYLANPLATHYEIEHAIELANLEKDILLLPDKINTQLDNNSIANLSCSFMQRLSLAQNYLKKPAILLLDEPTNTLDIQGENALLKAIDYLKGHATIFIISHQPSHLKMADKIILLHEGQVLLSGQTSQVWARIPKEFLNE